MKKWEKVAKLLREIKADEGTPEYIKQFLDGGIIALEGKTKDERILQNIVTILDASSNDPNVSFKTRQHIWKLVPLLEKLLDKKATSPFLKKKQSSITL